MIYGFSFNGRHSREFEIFMKSDDRTLLPAKTQASYTIPGRDGTYNSDDFDYQNRIITVQIAFFGATNNMESLRQKVRDIAKWLSGQGNLIFDDEPDKAYTAKVINGINLTQIVRQGQAVVSFNCQPFAESIYYKTVQKTVTNAEESITIDMAGTYKAYPIITVINEGTEDITNITIQRKAEKL